MAYRTGRCTGSAFYRPRGALNTETEAGSGSGEVDKSGGTSWNFNRIYSLGLIHFAYTVGFGHWYYHTLDVVFPGQHVR